MSNDPIREVTARDVWRAISQSDNSSSDGFFGSQNGHPDEIEDVVTIEANIEILERLKQSKNTDEVIALLPFEKKQMEEEQSQTQKEKILEYMKLPGERIDEPYVFAAAREAMFELVVDTKGDLNDHEKALITFSSLFAQKIREKENNPANRPDSQGETTIIDTKA